MSLWKPFLAMTIAAYTVAIGGAAIITLGLFGKLSLSPGLWFVIAIAEVVAIMCCFLCTWLLVPELKERRQNNDDS